MTLNIAHSEFPEQKGGMMICGYEWGGGDEEASETDSSINEAAICTFANKDLRYGTAAARWHYDNQIKKWFALWGRALDRENPGAFEKSIVQTNWCDTQKPRMNGDYSSLWQDAQIANFLFHIAHFRPRLLLLMGSKLIEALQAPTTLERFEAIMGKRASNYESKQKDFDGRRFKISFQDFERCKVVCFPHPSASRGLSDAYIALFADDMRGLLHDCERRFKV